MKFRCILTPNKVEFDRLLNAIKELYNREVPDKIVAFLKKNYEIEDFEGYRLNLLNEIDSESIHKRIRAASIALGGITILLKGKSDIISSGQDVIEIIARGSPRRCGGQGDILAGCLGAAFYWSLSKVG